MPPTTKTTNLTKLTKLTKLTNLTKLTKLTKTAKPVVVLFEVDETLVHTGGSRARSWKAAFDTL